MLILSFKNVQTSDSPLPKGSISFSSPLHKRDWEGCYYMLHPQKQKSPLPFHLAIRPILLFSSPMKARPINSTPVFALRLSVLCLIIFIFLILIEKNVNEKAVVFLPGYQDDHRSIVEILDFCRSFIFFLPNFFRLHYYSKQARGRTVKNNNNKTSRMFWPDRWIKQKCPRHSRPKGCPNKKY